MRFTPLLLSAVLLPVALLACSGSKGGDTSDTSDTSDTVDSADSGDTADSGDSGDTDPVVDEDRDGYTSDVDCNDNAYQIYPGAPELCDGLDNDCDSAVDEDFDADGDGHQVIGDCKAGDDCDDADPAAYPGAPETAYDGVDQDCDGGDLVDVDGDHAASTEVGGDDCDDNDATVYPGGDDVPFDGVDTNCDGMDGPGGALADLDVTIDGTDGTQDLLGYSVTTCDIDEDGRADLVISAPFASTYAGQIGIWYGSGSAGWSSGMAMSDADTLITSASLFLGFGLACADVDGDGHDDLVAGRGEIDYYTYYNTDYGLVIWYGDGNAWDARISEADGGVELSFPLGVTPNIPTVYADGLQAEDVDDDGAADLLIHNPTGDGYTAGDSSVYVLPGDRYTTDGSFVDQAGLIVLTVAPENAEAGVENVGDLDGDGSSEVLVRAPFTTVDDSGDAPGAFSLVTWDTEGGSLNGMSGIDVAGAGNELLGWADSAADLDGDGETDLAISAVGDTAVGAYAGTIYGFSRAGDLVGRRTGDAASDSAGRVTGEYVNGYLGWTTAPVGDLNGDGAVDLLASEPGGGGSARGRLYLLSGAALFTGADVTASEAALTSWDGEDVSGSTGTQLVAADFDGDGTADYALSAYALQTTDSSGNAQYTGRAYVLLSSSWVP